MTVVREVRSRPLSPESLMAIAPSLLRSFVLALGVSYATRSLIQAAALAVGVAIYTVDWGSLVRRVAPRRPADVAPT